MPDSDSRSYGKEDLPAISESSQGRGAIPNPKTLEEQTSDSPPRQNSSPDPARSTSALLSPGAPLPQAQSMQHVQENIAARIKVELEQLKGELRDHFTIAQATSLQSFSAALGYEGLQIAGNSQMELLIAEAFKPLEQVVKSRMQVLLDFVEFQAFGKAEEAGAGGPRSHAQQEKDALQGQMDDLVASIHDLAALVKVAPSAGAEERRESGSGVSSSAPNNPAVLLRRVAGRVASVMSASHNTALVDDTKIQSLDSEITYLTSLLEVASAELESNTSNLQASQAAVAELQEAARAAEARAAAAAEAGNQARALLRVRSQRFHELLQVKATAQTKVEQMEVELEAVKAASKVTASKERARASTLQASVEELEERLEDVSRSNRVLALENTIAVEHLRKLNVSSIELPPSLELIAEQHTAQQQAKAAQQESPHKSPKDKVGKSPATPGSAARASPQQRKAKGADDAKITWVMRANHPTSPAPTAADPEASPAPPPAPPPPESPGQGRSLGEIPKFWKAVEQWRGKCATVLAAAGVRVPGQVLEPQGEQVKGIPSLRTPTFLKKVLVESVESSTVDTLMHAFRRNLMDQGIKLPVERVGPFKYTLGSKTYNLKVTNGAICVRRGGGFADIIDIVSGLCPRCKGHDATKLLGLDQCLEGEPEKDPFELEEEEVLAAELRDELETVRGQLAEVTPQAIDGEEEE